jgi:hypothetical protein
MHLIKAFLFLSVFSFTATGETSLPSAEVSGVENASSKTDALDRLLSERESVSKLQVAIDEARKAGVTEQAILEARFLYHVDQREDDAIVAMLPDFVKQREKFKIEDSAIFGVKEDWLAVNEYVQAIAALKSGDKKSFKTHITEAFWLSPRQAAAFAPQIDRMRLEDAMREVKVDFESKLLNAMDGEAVTLKNLTKDKKATLIHFWSPASQECEASLPDYMTTAKALIAKGFAMVSISPESPPKILTDARTLLMPLGPELQGSWLIDSKENSLARKLRVQTLPTFVLVSNEGHVLYNGDPTDDGFWDALKKVNPEISRPQLDEAGE